MNHMMIESMKQTLALMREREEKCRDVALAIQRMLEAEGALYPVAIGVAPAGAAAVTGPEKAAAKNPQSNNGPRTWPKTCVICGKKFAARSARAKCCSPACVKEKNIRYSRAGYQAKAGKPAPKAAAPKAAQSPTGYQKVCVVCGKPFTPHRKDQKCCSTVCGQRRHLEGKPAGDPPAAANKAPVETTATVTRVDRIRAAMGRLDGLPQSAIDAAQEAAESDGAR